MKIKEKEEFNNQSIEIDFWILSDRPKVQQELIKQEIWNMRLEVWKDEQGKEKESFWMVEKQDFAAKNLSQNQILNSAIVSERNKMVVLKVRNDDENSREIVRKLGGINITETVLTDKNAVKEYKDHEAWLIEKNKLPSLGLKGYRS